MIAHEETASRAPSRTFRALPWAIVVLIVLTAALIRLRLLHIPLERDEGEYAYAGQLMLQGIPPYQIAWNMKLPGTYAAYALIMAVFGQTTAGIHLGFLLVNAATTVLMYLLGRRLFGPVAAIVACASWALMSVSDGVLGTQAHATHFVMIAVVGGAVLLLRALEFRRGPLFFASGLLFGIGILMKQHGVFFAAFGALYILWDIGPTGAAWTRSRWTAALKGVTLFAAGVSLPFALTCVALWQAGVFAKFWFWTFTYAREYVGEMSLADGLVFLKENSARVARSVWPLWLIAGTGLLLIWQRKEHRSSAWFTTGFLGFAGLAISPGLYFRHHYFVLLLPALALLAGAAVAIGRQIAPARWKMLPFVLFAAALGSSIFQQRKFFFEMTPAEASVHLYDSAPFLEAITIADYIRNHSSPGARIAVIGSEPEIYFYSRRHSATGYLYTYGMMEPQPYALTMQDEMIREIETTFPDFVVVVAVPNSWSRREESSMHILDWWNGAGQQRYRLVGTAEILRPGDTRYRFEEAGVGPPLGDLWLGCSNGKLPSPYTEFCLVSAT